MGNEKTQKKQTTWRLLCNGKVVETFSSHTKAKNALHWAVKEANENWLDADYEIRKVE